MCDEGYCQGNPTTKLKSPRLGKRIPKAFNEEEIEMLQEAGKYPIDFALTSFLFSTGCRIGEVQKLNRSDINWENRSCIVLGKGNKQREVYFGVKAKIRLKWYLESRNDDCPALFISQRRPYRRLSIDQLRRITKRVAEKANISNTMYPHKWRHTFAMHMLNKGAPLEAVQDQLGHEDMKTTRIYCQLSGARRKSIHDFYF
jgi:integrase/recombinase XerD